MICLTRPVACAKILSISMADERGAAIRQKNPEEINDKHQQIIEMFRAKAALNTTAWVLLFDSKPIRSLLYESLSSSVFNIVRQHSTFDENTVF